MSTPFSVKEMVGSVSRLEQSGFTVPMASMSGSTNPGGPVITDVPVSTTSGHSRQFFREVPPATHSNTARRREGEEDEAEWQPSAAAAASRQSSAEQSSAEQSSAPWLRCAVLLYL